MSARTVSQKGKTLQIPTQTLPIRELNTKAPKEEVARFIMKMLYEADDTNYEYKLDEFVKCYLLFGPQSQWSHVASVIELKRAILWLSEQKILYITNDLRVETHIGGPLQSREFIMTATDDAIRRFRSSFGKMARHWFYGNW